MSLVAGAYAFLLAIAARRATLATWLLALWAALAFITLAGLFDMVAHTT